MWHLHFAGALWQLWISALSTLSRASFEMTERTSGFMLRIELSSQKMSLWGANLKKIAENDVEL